jgi:hypothetical protein
MATSYLSQYNEQTQNAVKNAGLDPIMAAVNSNSNINEIFKEGLTPKAVSVYKDASGNTVKAPPNTYFVSNPDGSGGSLNYFFQIDPKTGATAPINNPTQNLTYTPGQPGGFVNEVVRDVKPLVPLAETAAAAFIPGAAPLIAGYNAANSVVSGKPITPSTLLNLATAASGFGDIGIDPSTLSTARNALAGANAIQSGNVMGLVNSIAQMSGSTSDVKSALNAANALTAAQKGDVAGLLYSLNNITGSVDPKIASLAKQVINIIEPTGKTPSSVNVDSSSKTVDNKDSTANVDSSSSTASVDSTNLLATPTGPASASGQTVVNPLSVPNMPVVKPPPATIGKITELDLDKLFNQVNSLNPVEDNTIQARQGGSLDDLLRLLNRG